MPNTRPSPRTLVITPVSLSRSSPSANTSNKCSVRFQHIGRFKLIERGEHRRTRQRVGAPGVGGFAVFEAGHHIAPPDDRRDRHPVPQAFAQADQVRFDAVFLEGIHLARAAEVGLHFIQDEQDVVLPAEVLEQAANTRSADDSCPRRPDRVR